MECTAISAQHFGVLPSTKEIEFLCQRCVNKIDGRGVVIIGNQSTVTNIRYTWQTANCKSMNVFNWNTKELRVSLYVTLTSDWVNKNVRDDSCSKRKYMLRIDDHYLFFVTFSLLFHSFFVSLLFITMQARKKCKCRVFALKRPKRSIADLKVRERD